MPGPRTRAGLLLCRPGQPVAGSTVDAISGRDHVLRVNQSREPRAESREHRDRLTNPRSGKSQVRRRRESADGVEGRRRVRGPSC
jgi:hypothetical protein